MAQSIMKRVLAGCTILTLLALGFFCLRIWRGDQRPAERPVEVPPATSDQKLLSQAEDEVIKRMVESEELLLALTPVLQRLNKSALNLRIPDANSRSLFAETIRVTDIDSHDPPDQYRTVPNVGATVYKWHVAHTPSDAVKFEDASWWRPLLDTIAYFEFAKFYFITAEFRDPQRTLWHADVGFEGLARTTSHEVRVVKALLTTQWHKHASEDPAPESSWHIADWELKELKTYEAPRKLFREVLDDALPDAQTRQQARTSIQDQLIVKAVQDPDSPLPTKYFDKYAFDRHPGASVVDIDGDGFDDLYVMDQWGKNLFLHNRGDGSFEDIAAKVGLDLENHCSSAVFADFDNDGDRDVFIGRTLERSRYLVNENGRFVDRSDSLVGIPLPYLVSSIAAADYNNDGLLDVYFSTYGADTIDRQLYLWPDDPVQQTSDGKRMLLAEFLPQDEALHLMQLRERQQDFTARVGPPNVLLENRGGRFELSPANEQLQVWRNTYQSTWGDFDNDGDPDIYCANDFSPNNLFRNNGDGSFADITATTKTADIGFGMGAAWGDYDNDGRQDLYVSNMYSKAGQRITKLLGSLADANFRKMASGNSLFCNLGADFKKVSGTTPTDLAVEVAGWSWGGQFLDVDNDGYLDVFATSGYYSAPPAVAVQVDL